MSLFFRPLLHRGGLCVKITVSVVDTRKISCHNYMGEGWDERTKEDLCCCRRFMVFGGPRESGWWVIFCQALPIPSRPFYKYLWALASPTNPPHPSLHKSVCPCVSLRVGTPAQYLRQKTTKLNQDDYALFAPLAKVHPPQNMSL